MRSLEVGGPGNAIAAAIVVEDRYLLQLRYP
jgi:hypothetical protein